MIEPGQRVGSYEVEALLGQGGMARVLRVRHATLGGRYALKVLTTTSPGVRERLLLEGKVQSTLRHPHIVAVHDVLDVDGQIALLMDWVDGPTLSEWLEVAAPSWEARERVFVQVCEALGYAHAHGVVHRDVKPGNVLVSRENGGHAWVTDFGIAKALAAEGDVQTRTGAALGTPRYMAPEQIRDARTVDARADVYALGCLLYELACGAPPIEGTDVISIYQAAIRGTWIRPRVRAPELPERVEEAIVGAMAGQVARRIPDVPTLLSTLRGAPWTAPAGTEDTTWSEETPVLGGHYRLDERLGGAQVLQTWKGTDTRDGRAVVVKLLRCDLASPKELDLFERNLRVLAELDHEQSARLLDRLEARRPEGVCRVAVLGWVPGETLEALRAGGRMSADAVLAIGDGVLSALTYLHGLSPPVVHRRLAPGNIVRTPRGGLVLIDFAHVKDELSDVDLGGETWTGVFGYAAPEQHQGDASPATDVYGAGAVLASLLTGRPGKDLLDHRGALAWRRHASVDDAVGAWLDRLLTPDPAGRPTAAAARAELRALRQSPEPTPEVATRQAKSPEPEPLPRPALALAERPPPVEPDFGMPLIRAADARPVANPLDGQLGAEQLEVRRPDAGEVGIRAALSASHAALIGRARPGLDLWFWLPVALAATLTELVAEAPGVSVDVDFDQLPPPGEWGWAFLAYLQSAEFAAVVNGFLLETVLSVICVPLLAGVAIVWLRIFRGQPVRPRHMADGFRFAAPLLLAAIAVATVTTAGTVALVIPGIILMCGLYFTPLLIVDKNLSALEAMRASWQLTQGHKGTIFWLTVVIAVINALGGLFLFGVGLLYTAPLTAGAIAYAYHRLATPGNAYLEDR